MIQLKKNHQIEVQRLADQKCLILNLIDTKRERFLFFFYILYYLFDKMFDYELCVYLMPPAHQRDVRRMRYAISNEYTGSTDFCITHSA